MTSTAKAAFGTQLKKGTTAIAELTSIGAVGVTREMIDATSHDSDDGYKEYIPGLIDTSELPIEGILNKGDAGQTALLTDLEAGTLGTYTIEGPTGNAFKYDFSAYVTAYNAGPFNYDGKITFSATLKISGKVDYTPAT
jgi:predicted secreted protein